MIKVLICDNQDIVREGLQLILETDADINVVGVASDGDEAIKLTEQLKPHIVLMDLKMPILNGIHATREIRTRFPKIYVLVLTTYDNDEWVFDAIRAGASGYLLLCCKDSKKLGMMPKCKEKAITFRLREMRISMRVQSCQSTNIRNRLRNIDMPNWQVVWC